ncbi:MAG: PAS domain S-box protein [Proteobacteria bacterium]|nr:PAS domain S-box protein [Pseudomonadota bacterium]
MFFIKKRFIRHNKNIVITAKEKNIKNFLLSLCWLVAVVMFHVTASEARSLNFTFTAEEKAWLSNSKKMLELLYDNDLPPIEISDQNNGFIGMGADIFEMIGKNLNIGVIKKYNKDQRERLGALKRDDCPNSPAIVQTPERQQFLLFSSVCVTVPVGIIARSRLNTGVSLKDLSKKKIAVVAGSAPEMVLKRLPGNDIPLIEEEGFSAVKQKGIAHPANHEIFSDTFRSLVLAGLFVIVTMIGVFVIWRILKQRSKNDASRLDKANQQDFQWEGKFRSFFEHAPLPFCELEIKTEAMHLNASFTETFGYSDDEIPNLDAWWPLAYPDPEYRKHVQREWNQAVRGDESLGISKKRQEFRITCKSGEVKNVVINATLMTRKVLITFFDITELTHYQTQLQKSLDRFQTLFDLLPFSCVINDMEGRYLLVNKHYCDTSRKPMEQIIGSTMEELGRRVDSEAKERVQAEILENGYVSEIEMAIEDDNTQIHILFSSCLIDWQDEPAILSATVDITDRKKTEKALEKSQERLTLAFDAANDGLWDLNLASEQMYCSPNYYKMLGYKQGDFSDTLDTWKKLVHPDDQEASQARVSDYISGKKKVYESEFRMQTKQGGWKWILSRGRIVEKDETGSPLRFVGTHIDITEKKLAEMALQESEENFRVTLDSIGDAVIATDINGNVTRMNPVAAQLTGWTTNEAAGRPLEDVFHIVNAETNDRVASPVQKVLATGKVVDLASHAVLLARDGTRYQIADSGSPIRNDSKKIIGVVLVFRDVTGAYAIQERLRQSQKMEAIGVLAGGIAHDFNNILSAVMGFTDLAKLEAEDQEPLKQYLDSVSMASLRARDLVQHILTFSRKSEVKKQIIYIDPIIKETLKFIRASLPTNIEICQEFNVHKARVLGDPTQIHQILMNLFTNAGHAMKNRGGKLEVRLDTVYVSRSDTHHFRHINPGQYYQLTISDTGTGIPKAIIDRIFEPFFTTKKREEGTGMGLSTVYGILKTMGGGISVYSEEAVGTTFKVLIPEKTTDVLPEKIGEQPLVKGKGKILVVDDEAPIVAGTKTLLSKLGYTVTGTTSSREALDRIRSAPLYFDLVLSDMTMPGMNGLELSRSIRAVNEDIPIILCTGFSEGLTKEICASTGIFDLVMKPLISAELSMTVHEAIKSIPGKGET